MRPAHLHNEMRKQAIMAMGALAHPRMGLVSSYDPTNMAVKVLLQPEGFETGWLPFMTPWVGNGWGMFSPPTPNDQVLVLFQEATVEAGMVIGGFFNDQDRPLSVPTGEFWLVHASGASLKLTNDGEITISGEDGNLISLTSSGINVTGAGLPVNISDCGVVNISDNVVVGQNLTVENGATGSFTTPTGQTVTVQDGVVTNIF